MRKENYKDKLHVTILYSIIIIGIAINIISNNNISLENKTQILKSMDETTEIANLNKTIDDLNASKTEYSNYINTSKTNLAKAITNAGVTTNGTDSFETMIANISNILSNKTNDATATAASILSGKTAYVKGSKVTGTMANNGAVTKTLSAGGSYTIPAGYHNGSGKVTANSLASQTQATATADNITEGKTAWVNGKLITGNGVDNNLRYFNVDSITISTTVQYYEIGFKPRFFIIGIKGANIACWYDEETNKHYYNGYVNEGAEIGSWGSYNIMRLDSITETGFSAQFYVSTSSAYLIAFR